MSFSDTNKGEVIAKFRLHDKDVGSPEVQIALLTARIETLTKHFSTNLKDHIGRVGMFRLVGQRKRLLAYLKSESGERYKTIINTLGLRK